MATTGKRTVCFGTALAAHALLLALVVRAELHKPPPPPRGHGLPLPVASLITLASPPMIHPLVQVVKEGKNPTMPCPKNTKSYTGIGVIYSWFEWEVLQAPHNFPAYLAGIRVGDKLLNVTPQTAMTVGKPMLIRTSRDGAEIDYTITPLKICYRDN